MLFSDISKQKRIAIIFFILHAKWVFKLRKFYLNFYEKQTSDHIPEGHLPVNFPNILFFLPFFCRCHPWKVNISILLKEIGMYQMLSKWDRTKYFYLIYCEKINPNRRTSWNAAPHKTILKYIVHGKLFRFEIKTITNLLNCWDQLFLSNSINTCKQTETLPTTTTNQPTNKRNCNSNNTTFL